MIVTCRGLWVLAAWLSLAACQPAIETRRGEASPAASVAPAAAPAPVIFAHDPGLDSLGHYLTDAAVQVGSLKLIALSIGQASDFADWEAGKRPTPYAPIFLEFEDVASPTAENELGQTYHTVSLRVMPTAYRVDAREVSFHGVDPQVGEVSFSGTFDLAALKAAKAAGPGAPRPVLRGDLKVGAQHFSDIDFLYFGGD